MKTMQKGFTLIELMIVVAIIGILAAIAIPAYQDYTVRAKVTEAIVLLDAAATGATDWYVFDGDWPEDNLEAGVKDSTSKYVDSVIVEGNEITATLTAGVHKDLGGKVITFVGDDSEDLIIWNCVTDIDNRYLPPSCRVASS